MVKNILIILDCLDKGGTQTLLYDFLNNHKNILSKDINLILLLTGSGNFEEELKSTSVKTFVFKRKKKIDLKLISFIKKLIKEYKIEIVHCHELITCLIVFITKYLYLEKIKVFYSIHGYTNKRVHKILQKFLVSKVTKVSFPSQASLNEIFPRALNNQKYVVLYNGIDVKRLCSKTRELRNELKLNNGSILLGMVGNFINDVRDQFTICKALPNLFMKYPHFYFVFVGSKSEKYPVYFDQCFNYCKEKNILDRVFFLGKRNDIQNILNSLDLFVYSSNHDTFGIALIEAILAGVPTIVNDIPVMLEVTRNGELSTLFKSKDVSDLEKKIDDFILNPEPYIQKALLAKEKASKIYSIESYIKKLYNIYYSI